MGLWGDWFQMFEHMLFALVNCIQEIIYFTDQSWTIIVKVTPGEQSTEWKYKQELNRKKIKQSQAFRIFDVSFLPYVFIF